MIIVFWNYWTGVDYRKDFHDNMGEATKFSLVFPWWFLTSLSDSIVYVYFILLFLYLCPKNRFSKSQLIFYSAAAAAKSLLSCLTLCDPIDGRPPGSPIPGILQAGILEWVTISFSSAWEKKMKVRSLSCVQLLATPKTAAYQAPLSMAFSRQEFWSGVPLPSPPFTLIVS